MSLDIELKTAADIDDLIDTLIFEEIFNEDALNQEFVVDTEGKTYRVSNLRNLSIEKRKKYQNIKFFIRLKEKPESEADFGECNLEEFLNSSDKKRFVYNKAFTDTLISIHNKKTIVNGKKLPFQDSLIHPKNITQCSISKECFVFPVITVHSNTFEALNLFQALKKNIVYDAEIIDPYATTKLTFNKIMPNKTLSALIEICHKNFIKNYCAEHIAISKNFKQNKQKVAATTRAKKFLKGYLDRLQTNTKANSVETAVFTKEEITAQLNQLAVLKKDLADSTEIIQKSLTMRKYSNADFTDYPQLKKDLAKELSILDVQAEKDFSKFKRTLIGGVLIGVLVILSNLLLNQIGIITSRAIYTAISILSFLIITGSVFKSTRYFNSDKYHSETNEIQQLNSEINNILECQNGILKCQNKLEHINAYQKFCDAISQSINQLSLEGLKNEIPVSLRPRPIATPTVPLSSSKYLLENAEKFSEKEFRKENKQEEDKEKPEDSEIKLPMDEEHDARTTLEFK